MPAALASGLRGIHSQPPDHAVVPPSCFSFSTTMTSRPSDAAVTAADSPAAPEPITSRSQTRATSWVMLWFLLVLRFSCRPARAALIQCVTDCAIGEGDGRSDGDARTGIDPAHDRIRLVAAGIEAI